MDVEIWVYYVEHGTLDNGEPRRLWMRQDGMGNWLVTQYFQSHPEFYLTADSQWSDLASPDARHTEHAARSLAISVLLMAEKEATRNRPQQPPPETR